MSRAAAQIPLRIVGEVGTMLTRREKTVLATGAVLCCISFWVLSIQLNVPTCPGYSVSILQQPSAFAAIVLTLLGFALCAILGTIVAKNVRYDAGLWCAAVALVALSARGGPMRYVLMSGTSAAIYVRLVWEIVLLAAFFEAAGFIERRMESLGVLQKEPLFDDPVPAPLHQKILATLTGVAIAMAIILVFCQSDRKLQVTIVVWFASLTAAATANYLLPASPARWFWAIPLLCGIIGYLGTYFLDPSGWVIGEPRGFLAPLARPLPLDYAGAGGAGAITGYWLGRWWHLKHEADSRRAEEGENNQPPGN